MEILSASFPPSLLIFSCCCFHSLSLSLPVCSHVLFLSVFSLLLFLLLGYLLVVVFNFYPDPSSSESLSDVSSQHIYLHHISHRLLVMFLSLGLCLLMFVSIYLSLVISSSSQSFSLRNEIFHFVVNLHRHTNNKIKSKTNRNVVLQHTKTCVCNLRENEVCFCMCQRPLGEYFWIFMARKPDRLSDSSVRASVLFSSEGQHRIFPAGCRNEPLLQPVLRIRDTQMQAENQHWRLSVF